MAVVIFAAVNLLYVHDTFGEETANANIGVKARLRPTLVLTVAPAWPAEPVERC
jgi:hypothetical protein